MEWFRTTIYDKNLPYVVMISTSADINDIPAPNVRFNRVGIVVPLEFWHDDPSRFSIDIEQYYHTLKSLGYEALLVSLEGSSFSKDVDWITAPIARYRDAFFWKSLQLDAVIFFTWLSYSSEVKAMRDAGIFVISRGDTAGTDSVRIFPKVQYTYLVESNTGLVKRLRQTKNFLDCYLRLYKHYDSEKVESSLLADAIAVETETARQSLEHFFGYYKQKLIAKKIIVCPHLLSDDILTTSVVNEPSCRRGLVAIGRWDEHQKDAPLLLKTLKIYLREHPSTPVTLIGRGGHEAFVTLMSQYKSVICTGPIPRTSIKDHLRNAQTLIITSRWETFHIAAHEALCLGCTVVGPNVIPVPDILRVGDFGEMVQQRSPQRLAMALANEQERWDQGKRAPEEIASFWRERLKPSSIVGRMLDFQPQP